MVIQESAIITVEHVIAAEQYSRELDARLPENLYYHGPGHTYQDVVPAVTVLSWQEERSISEQNRQIIIALFHDKGFIQQYEDNEPFGAKYLKQFMRDSELPFTEKDVVIGQNTILNTDMKRPPENIYEAIMRDGDMSYFTRKTYPQEPNDQRCFFRQIVNFREEVREHPDYHLYKASRNMKSWIDSSIAFMEAHSWFTDTAKKLFEPPKQRNLRALQALLDL